MWSVRASFFDHLVAERDAFRIVLLEPSLIGKFCRREHLEVVDVANSLFGVDINPNGLSFVPLINQPRNGGTLVAWLAPWTEFLPPIPTGRPTFGHFGASPSLLCFRALRNPNAGSRAVSLSGG